MHKIKLSSLLAFVMVAGCVTINVYFPAVAAEKAADKIIEDVWGPQGRPAGQSAAPASQAPQSSRDASSHGTGGQIALAVLNFVMPVAQAAEPNIDINSPAVRDIVNSMEARHPKLKPYYESGAIGLTKQATITIRNMGTVSLAKRNELKQLVSEENADRNALYREIAVANNHPEWESQIRATFADRWISNAQQGWYYEDRDVWAQK